MWFSHGSVSFCFGQRLRGRKRDSSPPSLFLWKTASSSSFSTPKKQHQPTFCMRNQKRTLESECEWKHFAQNCLDAKFGKSLRLTFGWVATQLRRISSWNQQLEKSVYQLSSFRSMSYRLVCFSPSPSSSSWDEESRKRKSLSITDDPKCVITWVHVIRCTRGRSLKEREKMLLWEYHFSPKRLLVQRKRERTLCNG